MRAATVAFLVASLRAAVATPASDAEVLPPPVQDMELEDACDASADSGACSLSLRQLRGEQRTAEVNRHMDLARAASHDAPSAACAANSKCLALGIEAGDCCPTADGTLLGCCDSAQTTTTTTAAPTNGTACSSFPGCVALGIDEGACCPTADGTMLGCCNGASVPTSTVQPKPESECTKFDTCVAANLTQGFCCPTVTGFMLDCCGDSPPASSSLTPVPEPAPVPAPPSQAAPVPAPPPAALTAPCFLPALAAIGFVNCGKCSCVHYTACPGC